jgi:endonuclease YncB( thermonuclease family)
VFFLLCYKKVLENYVGVVMVRFIGIDAPEVGQTGAAEATAFVTTHTLNQTVWLGNQAETTQMCMGDCGVVYGCKFHQTLVTKAK